MRRRSVRGEALRGAVLPSAVPMKLTARPANLVTQSVSSLVARLRTSRLRWQGGRGEYSQLGWFWPQVVDGGGWVSPSGVLEEVVQLPRPTGELNPAAPEILEAGFPRGVSLQACDDA